jgi:hypothetical protein
MKYGLLINNHKNSSKEKIMTVAKAAIVYNIYDFKKKDYDPFII